MKLRLTLFVGLLAVVCAVPAGETSYKRFPGAPLDERTLRAQERVEELYEAGDHARALLIYERDLAPKGDKYAQYMAGYMYLSGQSVPVDRPRALAWYRLAAERGDPVLVEARDALSRQLSPAEISASNQIFAELWQAMGDNRILLDLIREDLEILRARTGTRIPGASTSSPLVIINIDGKINSAEFYESARERVAARIAFLETNVEIIDIETDEGNAVTRALETELRRERAALDLP